jgi:tetratricopeptide (TPR) repeat protein
LLSASLLQVPDAVASFRRAIEVDSRNAAAHAGLALALCSQAGLRAVPYLDAYATAKTAALRALALDSASADAQTALGTVLFLSEWDWDGAERSFRRALDLNRAHVEALLQYGSLLEALGQLDEGLSVKQHALERDSNSSAVFVQIAWSYWHQRRFGDVIRWADRALKIDPRHVLAAELLLGAYWKRGDVDGLLGECVRRAQNANVSDDSLERLTRSCAEKRTAFVRDGLTGFTRVMLADIPQGERGPVWIRRAVLCAAAGDRDAAFVELDRGLAARDPSLVHLGVAPQWDSLRDDARFPDRIRSLGLPFVK